MNYIQKSETKLKKELSSIEWNEAKRMIDYFKSIKVKNKFNNSN